MYKMEQQVHNNGVKCKYCKLCLTEKFYILNINNDNSLNSRTEFVNKCRHRNKQLLKSVKKNDRFD